MHKINYGIMMVVTNVVWSKPVHTYVQLYIHALYDIMLHHQHIPSSIVLILTGKLG